MIPAIEFLIYGYEPNFFHDIFGFIFCQLRIEISRELLAKAYAGEKNFWEGATLIFANRANQRIIIRSGR